MTELKNFKTKSYLFLLLSPHHMYKHSKANIFPHTIFILFSWKALTAPLCCSWGSSVHRAERREPGRTHGHCGMASLALLAGTDSGMLMPCHLPPYLEGRYEWSCAGAPSHSQQRPAGWAQLSVRVWHRLTNFQAVTVWHNDTITQWHVWSHVLWKTTTSSASIRWDGKCVSNPRNRIDVLYVNCIYTFLGIDESISLHLYSLEFYYTFCNLFLKLLNRYSKLNLEWMY